MEGSESEAIFDSLNLNPQLFINETLNTVDDLLNDAFDFYLQEASNILKVQGTDRSHDLTKGVNYIHNMIQSSLGKRLAMWEKYCLRHCFTVPEGFSLPKNDELLASSSMIQDALSEPDVDAELDSLRNKLTLVGAETDKLNSELKELERQSASRGHCAELINQTLQLYEDSSVHDMFQEMTQTATELRVKMLELNTRQTEKMQHERAERVYSSLTDYFTLNPNPKNGLSNAKLDDLREFLAELK
ncbi:ARABIDOPSIS MINICHROMOSOME INSTABILITY 12 (MIS12)-LIKE, MINICHROMOSOME INSTABILITY 12 (MIS12)-LIKE [Hibiscus trionum]|uniref:ARABIDOPSIS MINICHROMOSOME INSTABILITY 12 (MIS12)-LIKE, MINICHROMOSOME INSTABILITY 12 (MIS12)-LIKE n=1 Tax=Hibiscus trionum TaxID=183268 RepID=A0A9W7GXI8_HIBTR|nr:ARABIDOPSIS MINICHROMOSOME INSTABILITY 12 (MIS12)-LIKE, MINICHROMOSOME INSTABILITY 12 (MIS12)-LIKE [Hibiscus trionum]